MLASHDMPHMQHALGLARAGLGHTWPNPTVGAVVVKDGVRIGEGATARGGRPHAEPIALAMAGEKAKGATLYVTLEPCSHHGKTPPCAEAIIAAGIARVVAACGDPNPKVGGKGFVLLRAAGIEVEQGLCEAEALAVNEGFFSVINRKRPFVMLKLATSQDGKIAYKDGRNQWITNEESRLSVQALRASYDAILTGIGTVLADDPRLNVRLPGHEVDSPQRIVLDTHLRIPLEAKVLPAWIVTSKTSAATQKARLLEEQGTKIIAVKLENGQLSLTATLAALAVDGITRLMIEAGSALAGEVVRQHLADRIYWFRAPLVIGTGLDALKGESRPISSMPSYHLSHAERLSEDILEIYDYGSI